MYLYIYIYILCSPSAVCVHRTCMYIHARTSETGGGGEGGAAGAGPQWSSGGWGGGVAAGPGSSPMPLRGSARHIVLQ